MEVDVTTQDGLYVPLQFLSHQIEVHCPACSKKAALKASLHSDVRLPPTPLGLTEAWNDLGYVGSILTDDYRDVSVLLSCSHCAKQLKRSQVAFQSQLKAVDPYLGLELYLKKEFSEGVLWAYNQTHVELLLRYIGSSSRDKRFKYNLGGMQTDDAVLSQEMEALYGHLSYDMKKKAIQNDSEKRRPSLPMNRTHREKFAHSFSENLPKWVKLAKNRAKIIKALQTLKTL
jgi:hypothetical protein